MRMGAPLSLAALLLMGCATGLGGEQGSKPVAKDLPRMIAVLPFVPAPEKEEPARVLARMIYGAVSATSYDVLKPQIVEERLVRAGLTDPKALAGKDPA